MSGEPLMKQLPVLLKTSFDMIADFNKKWQKTTKLHIQVFYFYANLDVGGNSSGLKRPSTWKVHFELI